MWKTFKKWCSFVRCPCPDFLRLLCYTGEPWDTFFGSIYLPKKQKCSFWDPLIFHFATGWQYQAFFFFFKNCKKVHEWYLEVKCKKSNKWVHFLSVKTSKNTLFLQMRSLILRQIDVTQLFRLFHTRAPRGHPTRGISKNSELGLFFLSRLIYETKSKHYL